MPVEHPIFPDASDTEIERRFKDGVHIDVLSECFGRAALIRALQIEPVKQPENRKEQPNAA